MGYSPAEFGVRRGEMRAAGVAGMTATLTGLRFWAREILMFRLELRE